ncbi:hypothetical protein FJZ33_02750 [Candidatus Poribacteria bacterium]|nr:hypothetical protein [Candidatus Poribacteria bacterium]
MAFDDGTPLDAAALQDLDRRIIEIQANIPRIGDSTSASQGIQSSTVSAKQIVGGWHYPVELKPGKATPFEITFKGVESDPKAVILSPTKASDIPSTFSFAVSAPSLTSKGVKGNAYLNSAATKGFTIGFFYIVICH